MTTNKLRLSLIVLAVWAIAFPAAWAEAGSLVIPAWSFARGNVRIHANPDEYAATVSRPTFPPAPSSGSAWCWARPGMYDDSKTVSHEFVT